MTSKERLSMQSYEVPIEPWIKIGIDLFEHNKQQYLLIVDYYSRFPIIQKLHSLSAPAVITKVKEIFSEHDIPDTVVTDRGPQLDQSSKNLHTSSDFSTCSLHPITINQMGRQKDL